MSEADFWACQSCRSINTSRSNRCYKCHIPREVAGVKPTELSVTEPPPVFGPTGTYRSSENRAVLATVATVAFILGTYVALWTGYQVGSLRADRQREAADQLFQSSQLLLALPVVLGLLALVAYGYWISRAVENLPPLGAGYSRVSPRWAFFEPLIPGLNLYSLPARAGEVISKLGGSVLGTSLIAISFFLIIGPPIAAGILLRAVRFVEGREFWRTLGTTLLASFTVQVVGLVIALYVLWHIEGMFRRRVAGEGSGAAASATPSDPAESGRAQPAGG
jgi:F0F1-type ATP synthase membrane subunit c/vacuolar-type H+-ATPase subunit K